jgi:TonB family protein
MRSAKPYKPSVSVRQIIDYLQGRLTNRAKNRLERDMLADTFESEAFDGLSRLSGNELEHDLKILSGRIDRRHQKIRMGSLLLRVASVLVLLLVPSIIIWIVVRTGNDKELAQQMKQEEMSVTSLSVDKNDSAKLEKPIVAADISKRNINKFTPPVITPDEEVADDAEEMKTQQEVSSTTISAVDYDKGTDDVEIPILMADTVPQEEKPSGNAVKTLSGKLAGVDVSRSRGEMKKEMSAPSPIVKGKVVDDQNQPLQGVSVVVKGTTVGALTDVDGNFVMALPDSDKKAVLEASFIGFDNKLVAVHSDSVGTLQLKPNTMAMNEVVVVGYGAQKESETEITTQPEPLNGMREYEKALNVAVKFPDNAVRQKEVVVLRLTINESGTITDIKVLKSPGKAFEDEAIRVVRSGPGWIAARNGNTTVEGTRKVRIAFEPEKK